MEHAMKSKTLIQVAMSEETLTRVSTRLTRLDGVETVERRRAGLLLIEFDPERVGLRHLVETARTCSDRAEIVDL
ncbi:hypothetical protein AY586_10365 [Marichromatium gracile]|uniref:Uncharacterized protein n=2 Tax=Marichromatium gracile TaxID=1048 RepID=A0ABR5VHY7_MARGR|nr:hypothetical protein AY586_10365 [Marichromatium gracile]